MRNVTMIAAVFCFTPLCLAEEFKPFDGPRPIAAFIQSDPWSMVIGSDTPRVAVYDDGQVIFAKKADKRLVYHHVTVDKESLAKLCEQFKPVLALKDLKPAYNIRPNVTDMPEAMFYLRDGDREVATTVYGLMAAGTELPAYTEFPNGPKSTVPPKELLSLHKWLCDLDFRKSEKWTPKYVEVMLWDYSYAPDSSIRWPKDWPSLNSPRAIKRHDDYSVFLDGALLPKLQEFLGTRKEKGAVEVDGKKFAASYRFTFPGEPTWHKAFQTAGEKAGEK
jgi:hypothetical protein